MKFGFKREPVAWIAAIHAVLALIAGFGIWNITTEQLALVDAVLTAIAALIIRQNVYAPVDKKGNPILAPPSP